MFSGCTSLKSITCLAKAVNSGSLTNWVSGVPSGGVFYADGSSTIWTTGVSGIPSGWTRINV